MIEPSDELARLDLTRIHGWLAGTRWSPGIERAVVEKAAAGSRRVGAYNERGARIGYFFLDRSDHADIRRSMLATRDAREVYRPLGVAEPARPGRLMERLARGPAATPRRDA